MSPPLAARNLNVALDPDRPRVYVSMALEGIDWRALYQELRPPLAAPNGAPIANAEDLAQAVLTAAVYTFVGRSPSPVLVRGRDRVWHELAIRDGALENKPLGKKLPEVVS